MYRKKIREYYEHLSPSYAKVADFIMSHYYEVAFMTAAQLADSVGVDTTTVVRFSQRLGYNGYPDLLRDIRRQVKSEIYSTYEPESLPSDNLAAVFRSQIEQEERNLGQLLIQNPSEHLQDVLALVQNAQRIFLVAEGYAGAVAEMAAEQLRHQGIQAEAVEEDPVKRAATLMNVDEQVLIIGISATEYGQNVARALEYGRAQGSKTLGIVGSLNSPVNRVADQVIYAPTNIPGPLPSIVALVAALASLTQVVSHESSDAIDKRLDEFNQAYRFLTQPEENANSMEPERELVM